MSDKPQAAALQGITARLKYAYNFRGKRVLAVTGATEDVFWCEKKGEFLPLQQLLYQEFSENFLLVELDSANGIQFYTPEDEEEFLRICSRADGHNPKEKQFGNVKAEIVKGRGETLSNLVLLREAAAEFALARTARDCKRPLGIIVQLAGSMFPEGDFGRLGELDRQRLVTLLTWVGSPAFAKKYNFVLLVSNTRSELNSRIFGLPTTEQVTIDLPSADDRRRFAEGFLKKKPDVRFERDVDTFVADTSGLTLLSVEDLLQVSDLSKETVTRAAVVQEINVVMEAQMGGVVTVKRPTHTPEDLIGPARLNEVFFEALERCENPKTAPAGILVAGPNGGGKSYRMEAYAATSGRVVIELTGLRDSLFGGTDKFTELFRRVAGSFGKIMVLIDEAHTAFGSVHSKDTHETEKRLHGNVIKMMSDPFFRGKILWGLMSSRPDELDPDVKDRCPIQIPIFDLEGDERRAFVAELFKRKGVPIDDATLEDVMKKTEYYSVRAYDNLVGEVVFRKGDVKRVLQEWQAGQSIKLQRRFQTLVAVQHCTYPKLIPPELASMSPEDMQAQIDVLRLQLQY